MFSSVCTDTSFLCLLHLDYNSLRKICSVNKEICSIYSNEYFWNLKYIKDFSQKEFTHSWKNLYLRSYLLNLDYGKLIFITRINNINLDDEFWYDKFTKDFLTLNKITTLEELVLNSWEQLYEHASSVSNNYPLQSYSCDETDINNIFLDDVPLLSSSDPKFYTEELVKNLSNNWGLEIVKSNGKRICLYNIFIRSRTSNQVEYEEDIKMLFIIEPLLLINNLDIGDCLILYMFIGDPWSIILTRNINTYELSFRKSYKEEIFTTNKKFKI